MQRKHASPLDSSARQVQAFAKIQIPIFFLFGAFAASLAIAPASPVHGNSGDGRPIDFDGDGFPDQAELHNEADRQAFRLWLVRIAEAQLVRLSPAWNKSEHDCAGLIRFAYREALKEHDPEWHKRTGIQLDKSLPDVAAFRYPDVPLLGKTIFRIAKSASGNHPGFSTFADTQALLNHNVLFIGRALEEAQIGDLLFFRNPLNTRQPHHSMIITQLQPMELVYHTGSNAGLKRVRRHDLLQSGVFSPHNSNPSFLGLFRFHIIN